MIRDRCGLLLIDGPDNEPVTVAEVKTHAKIQTTSEDTLLGNWITSARQLIEVATGRALCTQTWRLTLDTFPPWEIDLDWGRLQAVESVKYYDTAGVQQTWSSSNYLVDAESEPGRIVPVDSWPSIADRINAVAVEFTVGYSDDGDDVPQALKTAIKFAVADWFENRERPGELSDGVKALIRPFSLELGAYR